MPESAQYLIETLSKHLRPPEIREAPSAMVPAAVLVPLVLRDGAFQFIFTLRTMTVAHHKGQISFPGGAAEPEDAGPVQTALRETNEEIGLAPKRVRPLGCLDDLVSISGFRVTPVVGWVDPTASFTPNPVEVAEIFELPAAEFFPPGRHRKIPWTHRGIVREVHSYDIRGRTVWGLTGEIVYRLTALPDPNPLRDVVDGSHGV